MKAVIYEKYGPPGVLQITDVEKPAEKVDEVLIKIHASTVHIGDVRMRIPDPFLARLVNGLFRPRKIPILGMELAGEIEAAGTEVTRFVPGDQVFAFTGFKFGAYAEYICLPERGTPNKGMVEIKPDNLTYEQAAALPGGGMTALALIRKAKIQSGQKVLIFGASGSVGTYAVQLASHLGAQVTGVCSGANVELVRSIGADHVIDYTSEDFSEGEKMFDVIIDAVHKLKRQKAQDVLNENGVYLDVHKDSNVGGKEGPGLLQELKELVEAGALKPVIDRRYALDDIVEAHRYVEGGHKKGNVVVQVKGPLDQAGERI